MALTFAGQVMDDILLSRLDAPIGTYRQSDLTLAQYQAQTPGIWVLADGAACAGSTYATVTGKSNVPDMRGTVPRMKDNGKGLNPDGELTLGSYQADNFGTHTHVQNSHNHIEGFAGVNGTASYGVTSAPSGNINSQSGTNTNNHPVTSASTAINQNAGGNETRMKNTTVNYFFKIGY